MLIHQIAFGETDATTGEWKIKTSPSGCLMWHNWFFFLKMIILTLVSDQSPNSNNWTVDTGTFKSYRRMSK